MRPRLVRWPQGMCCVGFESPVLRAVPLPRAVHSPVPDGCLRHVFPALLVVTASCCLRVKLSCIDATRPPPQHPGFQCKSLLQHQAGENKPAACGALAPICHPLHSALAPASPLYGIFFFPMAAPAGLWPDTGITCFGSSLWYYSRGCQHTSPLPPFSNAKVFSLMDIFSYETCLGERRIPHLPTPTCHKVFTGQARDCFPATFRKMLGLHFVFSTVSTRNSCSAWVLFNVTCFS